jgi:DnaK suppressor protein
MSEFMDLDQLALFQKQIEQRVAEIEERQSSQKSLLMTTDSNEMSDEADRASVEEARNIEMNRIEHDKQLLSKLRSALTRISSGDFGFCESCGEEISLQRLHARPESRFCIECQSVKEFNEVHVYRRVA